MKNVDGIIKAKWVVTCNGNFDVLTDHALVYHDGKIITILPNAIVDKTFTAKETRELLGHCIMPGFINGHTHAGMNYFRGIADDLEFFTWLKKYMLPLEARWLSDAFVYDAVSHAIAEMIRGGVTCFNDMYYFTEATARAASHAGIRAFIGINPIGVPTSWSDNDSDIIKEGMHTLELFKDHPLVKISMCPHSVYMISDETLMQCKELADEYEMNMQVHVQENKEELENCLKERGKSPLQHLHALGLTSRCMQAVHMTQLIDEDFKILKETGVSVIHCPESNMKLARGYAPIKRLLDEGINVALGTDSTASNNDLDMMGEMRSASFLGKLMSENTEALSAKEVLQMATINGAKAVGLGDHIGSLEANKDADFIAIDLSGVETTPCYHPVSQLVYAASRKNVTDVWVAGKLLLRNRTLQTLNESTILQKAETWRQKITTESEVNV